MSPITEKVTGPPCAKLAELPPHASHSAITTSGRRRTSTDRMQRGDVQRGRIALARRRGTGGGRRSVPGSAPPKPAAGEPAGEQQRPQQEARETPEHRHGGGRGGEDRVVGVEG